MSTTWFVLYAVFCLIIAPSVTFVSVVAIGTKQYRR